MILTKHTKQRYRERFGIQDDKEILRRCVNSVEFFNDGKGLTKRSYGCIVFVVLNNEFITTITKKTLDVLEYYKEIHTHEKI